MHRYVKILLASAAVCALSLTVSASETTQQQNHASAQSGQTDAPSRVFGGGDTEPSDATGADMQTASADAGHDSSGEHGGQAGHWGYEGAGGPEQWGQLNADYHLCSAGQMQSPIDINGGFAVEASDIAFNYTAAELTIGNNGHTIQTDFGQGSHILVNGQRFDLLQFHFHTPSEHLISGKTYPMEMHLVHRNDRGELAVVGVMMESGASNLALGEIWNHLPHHPSDATTVSGVVINARDLLPDDRRYHHYKGSLTTPPCSEGVNWFVLNAPIQVGAGQIAAFTDITGANARPAQQSHNRLLISGGMN